MVRFGLPVVFVAFVCVAGNGCTRIPAVQTVEAEGVASEATPRLLPIDQLLNVPAAEIEVSDAEAVLARVARLERRAARLRRIQVIDPETRARMRRGVRLRN